MGQARAVPIIQGREKLTGDVFCEEPQAWQLINLPGMETGAAGERGHRPRGTWTGEARTERGRKGRLRHDVEVAAAKGSSDVCRRAGAVSPRTSSGGAIKTEDSMCW